MSAVTVPQREIQHAALELRQFIEKQHAVMCERNLAGRGIDVAAQQAGVAGSVMRRAERPLRHQRLARGELTHLRLGRRIVQSYLLDDALRDDMLASLAEAGIELD